MTVELVDVCDYLLHSRVGFSNAGALVYDASFDTLNIGGNLVHCRRRFGHIAGQVGTYF